MTVRDEPPTASGCTTQVTGRRSGPPVLMIQGLGADKHGWDMQRLALAWRYRTIALDNRGAGRSDKPHGAYTLEQMADDADRRARRTPASRRPTSSAPRWAGRSARSSPSTYPERVRSLTLVCTSCRNHPWRRELLASWGDAGPRAGHGRDDRARRRAG